VSEHWRTQRRLKGFNPHWMFLLCLHNNMDSWFKLCSCVDHILNFVQEDVKHCRRTLISHFASEFASFCFVFRPLAHSPFRKFLIHHLWTPSIIKTWVRLCYGSVSNVSFLQWFRPGPRWGDKSAPPEPTAEYTGSTSDSIQFYLLQKITPFSHSGKPTGIVITTA